MHALSTRDTLLKSAKKLFALRGYDGTSVQDLVKDAGVNVSLVSYHFGGKAGLYRACLDQFGAGKLATAERLLAEAATVSELQTRLSLFIEEMFRSYIDEPELVRIIHRDIELDNPVSRSVFESRFLKIFDLVARLFEKCQKKNLFRANLDPELLAALFYGMFTHMIRSDSVAKRYYGKSLKDPAYRENLRETILQVFFNGVTS